MTKCIFTFTRSWALHRSQQQFSWTFFHFSIHRIQFSWSRACPPQPSRTRHACRQATGSRPCKWRTGIRLFLKNKLWISSQILIHGSPCIRTTTTTGTPLHDSLTVLIHNLYWIAIGTFLVRISESTSVLAMEMVLSEIVLWPDPLTLFTYPYFKSTEKVSQPWYSTDSGTPITWRST